MGKVVAYIRVSTDTQDINTQRLEVLDYAQKRGLLINQFIELEASTRRSQRARQIDFLFDSLGEGDTLILAELSRLGRSVNEIINLVNKFIEMGVRIIMIKEGLDFTEHNIMTKTMITTFGLVAELERDLISQRTKAGLARARASGKKMGRPRKSKLEPYREDLEELRAMKISAEGCARWLLHRRNFKVHAQTVLRFFERLDAEKKKK